jgi:hypothetical protein
MRGDGDKKDQLLYRERFCYTAIGTLTALLSQKDLAGCIVLYMALADQEPNWQINFLFRRIA